jgi:hypothetical protein
MAWAIVLMLIPTSSAEILAATFAPLLLETTIVTVRA